MLQKTQNRDSWYKITRPQRYSALLWLDVYLYEGGCISRAVNTLYRLPKIRCFRRWNIRKDLRVSVHQRKPRTLQLDHDPVSLLKTMIDIRHGEPNLLDVSRPERFWLLKAMAEFAAEWLTAYELLISAQRATCILGVNVNQLHNVV